MAQARVLFAGQHAQSVKNLYEPRILGVVLDVILSVILGVMPGVLYPAVANDCEMPPSSPCSKCCKAWCKERGERSRADPHSIEYFYTKVYIIIIMGHYHKQARERFYPPRAHCFWSQTRSPSPPHLMMTDASSHIWQTCSQGGSDVQHKPAPTNIFGGCFQSRSFHGLCQQCVQLYPLSHT